MMNVTKIVIKDKAMRNVKVLGIGSSKYKELTSNLFTVIEELNIDAEVEQFNEVEDFIRFNLVKIPTLIIDGQIISKGSVLNIEELKTLFNQSMINQTD